MMTDIKVKHLDAIMSPEGTTPFELLEIEDSWINRVRYKNDFYVLSYNLNEFLETDVSKIKYEYGDIKLPSDIDNIPFQQMMTLQSFKTKGLGIADIICKKIAIVCSDANKVNQKSLEHRVSELPYKEAFGIMNWIRESQKESTIKWEKRFMSVRVDDKDYDLAGGQALDQFNVINTIKNTCNDFNVSYEEAWQMPFSVIQSNSYAKATAAHVQFKMEKIKEARMMAQQKKHH